MESTRATTRGWAHGLMALRTQGWVIILTQQKPFFLLNVGLDPTLRWTEENCRIQT